jgi:hypothetical protein
MAVEFEDPQFKVSVNPKDVNKVIVQEVKNEVKIAIGGPQGVQGDGVVAGGTTGQSLVKSNNTSFATTWADRVSSITAGTGLTGGTVTTTGTFSVDGTVIPYLNAASQTFTGDVTIGGNLTINGTTTVINSTTVTIDDKNLVLGNVASSSNTTADGGGLTVEANTGGDKTWNWVNSTGSWTSSENINLASGKTYLINGITVLSTTQVLGYSVTNANTASTIVARDASGSFSAGTITATLTGTATYATTANAVALANVSGLATGIATFLATPSSSNLLAAVTDETGTGNLVFSTSPTLTTPILGVASATSINKLVFTAPATSATLTIADSKTATISNTLTFAGTDGSTLNIGAGGILGTGAFAIIANYAALTASQTFTGTQTLIPGSAIPTLITRAYSSGSANIQEWQNSTGSSILARVDSAGNISSPALTSTVATGTAPLTVTSTTKVANLNADLLDGYNTDITTSASTVVVRDSYSAINAKSLNTSGYKTSSTGAGTYTGQWTSIAYLFLPSRFSNNEVVIDFSSDGPSNTDNVHGRLFVSVKQQDIMGNSPQNPTMILYNGFNTTIDDFALVVTQNDAALTIYTLYFRNNIDNQIVSFLPILMSSPSNFAFSEGAAYITNLPSGVINVTNNAINPPETDIIPLDNLANDFNGVSNRFQMKYQGTAISMKNPFRLLVSVNGVVQTVNTPDYVWQSPIAYDGLFLDSDGYITLSDIPPLGSTFDGRILGGATTSTKTKNYPFRAVDLLIGA